MSLDKAMAVGFTSVSSDDAYVRPVAMCVLTLVHGRLCPPARNNACRLPTDDAAIPRSINVVGLCVFVVQMNATWPLVALPLAIGSVAQ